MERQNNGPAMPAELESSTIPALPEPGATYTEPQWASLPDPVYSGPRSTVTADDRVWAALAHAAMLLNLPTGVLGIPVSLGIWFLYRDRQRWVAKQALQATVAQLVVILLIGLATGSLGIVAAFFWLVLPLLLLPVACVAAVAALALFVYSLFAAIQVYSGRDFRYPVIGAIMDAD